jgi:hypothetical protein
MCFCPANFEFFNSACGVNQFFLAGKEGVAGAANLHINFFFGGTNNNFIPASTFDNCIGKVFWMYVFFHINDYNIKNKKKKRRVFRVRITALRGGMEGG